MKLKTKQPYYLKSSNSLEPILRRQFLTGPVYQQGSNHTDPLNDVKFQCLDNANPLLVTVLSFIPSGPYQKQRV
jgi:hypothetical protein